MKSFVHKEVVFVHPRHMQTSLVVACALQPLSCHQAIPVDHIMPNEAAKCAVMITVRTIAGCRVVQRQLDTPNAMLRQQ